MTVNAFLNTGRWIAKCPDCPSAALVYPGYKFICGDERHGPKRQRAFFIQLAIVKAEAANEPVIHVDDGMIGIPIATAKLKVAEFAEEHARQVIWPTPAKKKKIDKMAVMRREPNRNWPVKGDDKTPFDFSESIVEMQNENERHGLGRGD